MKCFIFSLLYPRVHPIYKGEGNGFFCNTRWRDSPVGALEDLSFSIFTFCKPITISKTFFQRANRRERAFSFLALCQLSFPWFLTMKIYAKGPVELLPLEILLGTIKPWHDTTHLPSPMKTGIYARYLSTGIYSSCHKGYV